ncbi:DUF2776 family protein [Escherichia coli]
MLRSWLKLRKPIWLTLFLPVVLVGLGAVCLTLFSIVSILEAGSAKK